MGSPKPIAGYPSRTAACLALQATGLTPRQIADRLKLYPSDVAALLASKLSRTGGTSHRGSSSLENGRPVLVLRDVLKALRPHAARRDISVDQLARDLLATIADDGLVDSILDDATDLPPQPQQVPA